MKIIILLILFPVTIRAQIINTIAGSGVYDPQQMVFDNSGNLYISSLLGNKIYKLDTSGILSVFAGTGTAGFFGDSGPASTAELNEPVSMAVDTSGNIYIGDANNHRVRKIDIITGIITTIAGTGTPTFGGDGGPATAADIVSPSGLYVDKRGNIYVSDFGNRRIRYINNAGIITTIAGNGTFESGGDGGLAIDATVSPSNILKDVNGILYFLDSETYVRMIDTNGIISRFAGVGTLVYHGENIPADSQGMEPTGLALNPYNQLIYITDNLNYRIYEVNSDRTIHTIAGNGIEGVTGDGGMADSAEIYDPTGIVFDHCGNLYLDQIGYNMRKILLNPYCWSLKVRKITQRQITLSPNPAITTIRLSSSSCMTEVLITDFMGQVVLKKQEHEVLSDEIDVSQLSAVLYLLESILDDGEKVVRKFVKN